MVFSVKNGVRAIALFELPFQTNRKIWTSLVVACGQSKGTPRTRSWAASTCPFEPLAASGPMQFIAANRQNDIHLKDLAKVANLSPFHFARAFGRRQENRPIASSVDVALKKQRNCLPREEPLSPRSPSPATFPPSRALLGLSRAPSGSHRENIARNVVVAHKSSRSPNPTAAYFWKRTARSEKTLVI
jgi:hypothetical protein